MTITYIGAETDHGASKLSVTPSVPAGVSDGDTLWAIVSADQSTGNTVTDDSGNWTKVAEQDATDGRELRAAIFKKTASSEPANYTFTGGQASNKNMRGTIIAFSSASPIELDVAYNPVSHYDHTANELNPTNPAITTVTDGATVLLFHVQSHNEVTTAGQPSGYTSRVANPATDHRNHAIATKVVATAGTETPGAWTNAGTDGVAENLVFTFAMRESGAASSDDWSYTDTDGSVTTDGVVGAIPGVPGSKLTAINANARWTGKANTLASGVVTGRFWLKRVTGTGIIRVTLDNWATNTDITSLLSGGTPDLNHNGFIPIAFDQTIANPQIGIEIATATDVVTVGNAEVIPDHAKEVVEGSAPIYAGDADGQLLAVTTIEQHGVWTGVDGTDFVTMPVLTQEYRIDGGSGASYLRDSQHIQATNLWIGPDALGTGWTDNGNETYTCDGSQTGESVLEASVAMTGITVLEAQLSAVTAGMVKLRVSGVGEGAYTATEGLQYIDVDHTGTVDVELVANADFAGTISLVKVTPVEYGGILSGVSADDWID